MSAILATQWKSAIKALRADDLAQVVDTDVTLTGRRRNAYFERRLRAAVRDPESHVQLAARAGSHVLGYVLARRLRGEFGQIEPALRIEVLGTHPQAQGQGIGLALIDGVARYALDHGVPELRTQAAWTDYPMLGFLDRSGFTLADAQVVDLGMPGIAWQPIADDAATADEFGDGPALEIDYGKPAPDFDRLARDAVDIRSMTPEDLAGIVRIDRQLSGSQRAAFLRHALDETLADSAVRVSLTARVDGIIAGFLMARTDFGDYGRAEPVAVLDAIGVDPDFGHRGIAHALLSQLCVNATALGVERIESAVAYDALGLLGFLYSTGFAPSQRLAFVRRLA